MLFDASSPPFACTIGDYGHGDDEAPAPRIPNGEAAAAELSDQAPLAFVAPTPSKSVHATERTFVSPREPSTKKLKHDGARAPPFHS